MSMPTPTITGGSCGRSRRGPGGPTGPPAWPPPPPAPPARGAEAAVGAPHRSRTAQAGGQPALRPPGPAGGGGAQVVVPAGGGHGREEHVGVGQGDHGRHVAEAEARHQAGPDLLARGQPDGPVAVDQVVERGQQGVEALEGPVAGDDARLHHLHRPVHLPGGGAPLGVPGDRLLGHDQQRVARGAAEGVLHPLVEVGLVGVVELGRRVVLGDDGDVVGREPEAVQGPGQRRVGAAPGAGQHAHAGGGDGGVDPVAEAGRVGDDGPHRQAHARGPRRPGPRGGWRRPGPRRSPAGARRWPGTTRRGRCPWRRARRWTRWPACRRSRRCPRG